LVPYIRLVSTGDVVISGRIAVIRIVRSCSIAIPRPGPERGIVRSAVKIYKVSVPKADIASPEIAVADPTARYPTTVFRIPRRFASKAPFPIEVDILSKRDIWFRDSGNENKTSPLPTVPAWAKDISIENNDR
jgi:hypothetical protein